MTQIFTQIVDNVRIARLGNTVTSWSIAVQGIEQQKNIA